MPAINTPYRFKIKTKTQAAVTFCINTNHPKNV